MVLNLLSHLGKLRCSRSLVVKGQGQAWDSELRAVGCGLGPFPSGASVSSPCPEEAGKVARHAIGAISSVRSATPPSPPLPPSQPAASSTISWRCLLRLPLSLRALPRAPALPPPYWHPEGREGTPRRASMEGEGELAERAWA